MNQLEQTLTSLEIAEMVGREHGNVMKDIRRIIEHLGQVKSYESYFIEATYENKQNKQQPCFKLTKKGCELFATRMTGEKGTQFAVEYIERFNKMEQHLQKQSIPQVSPAELIAMMAQQGVEQEKRITAVEEKQDNITSILSLNRNDWRNKVNRIINAIAKKLGGGDYYSEIRNESYEMLEVQGNCILNRRLDNRKARMALGGSSKTAINKISVLDVIEEDKKLVSVYITVIKELAVKYQLSITKYNLIDETEEFTHA